MSTLVHPRYVIDEEGRKLEVILSYEEYSALMDRMEDFADAKLLHEIAAETSEDDFIPWEDVKADLRKSGKLD